MIQKNELRKYITQCYSSIRSKSKRRNDDIPSITKEELKLWLFDNNLLEMYLKYINSNRDRNLKPSINRIDDYGKYEFSNMELITWRENHIKGVNSKKHHDRSKNKNLESPCILMNKNNINIKCFESRKIASEFLGCHVTSISRVITGRRKTIKGFKIISI